MSNKGGSMDSMFQQKTRLLKALGTGELLTHLNQIIDEIAELQVKKQKVVEENGDFLGSIGRDCEAVKIIELDLILNSPEFEPDGKKLTADKRAAWVEHEKRANEGWRKATACQREVSFAIADLDIKIETASRRYLALKGYLELRSAQIKFLGE
jgi:hypothetical protein